MTLAGVSGTEVSWDSTLAQTFRSMLACTWYLFRNWVEICATRAGCCLIAAVPPAAATIDCRSEIIAGVIPGSWLMNCCSDALARALYPAGLVRWVYGSAAGRAGLDGGVQQVVEVVPGLLGVGARLARDVGQRGHRVADRLQADRGVLAGRLQDLCRLIRVDAVGGFL